eukprot:1186985-Prorocentrum_minimum.AAC.3
MLAAALCTVHCAVHAVHAGERDGDAAHYVDQNALPRAGEGLLALYGRWRGTAGAKLTQP